MINYIKPPKSALQHYSKVKSTWNALKKHKANTEAP